MNIIYQSVIKREQVRIVATHLVHTHTSPHTYIPRARARVRVRCRVACVLRRLPRVRVLCGPVVWARRDLELAIQTDTTHDAQQSIAPRNNDYIAARLCIDATRRNIDPNRVVKVIEDARERL